MILNYTKIKKSSCDLAHDVAGTMSRAEVINYLKNQIFRSKTNIYKSILVEKVFCRNNCVETYNVKKTAINYYNKIKSSFDEWIRKYRCSSFIKP